MAGEQADKEDIGRIVKLKVNNQNHDIRLVGLGHDDFADKSGKQAHTTFQFANLLCDKNGNSFGTIYDFNPEEGFTERNYDYSNSVLKKNLTGKGNGQIMWLQKVTKERSQKYINTTIMDMLPKALKDALKEVRKEIYNDADLNFEFYEEGKTYDYYLEDNYPVRTFNQISSDYNTETPGIDDVFEGTIVSYNYAGYCSNDPERILML